ncbi:MAG: gamma-glutamyltransferase [Deltaproteobacteria bacterium]|jgi:gamma-glutamyltranspeptidase/glutathione hydrolase|nr:gamma-glutamyltransferase [Deltaproteobacteria bacterium]
MKKLNKAIVATGHPLVSNAAIEILQQGGNAFDATVGAGFAGAVAEQTLTSLGGGGFLLARTNGGKEVLFDFFTDTPGRGLDSSELEPHFFPVTIHFPGSDQDFNIGLGSVAVPGNLKGFLHVHKRLGRLPLEEILQPAIHLARDGLELNDWQGYFLNLLEPIMTYSPEGRKLYTINGKCAKQGDHITNPEIGDFLSNLPGDQGENFYNGDLAKTIEKNMRSGQGLLTAADLAAYQVIERTPLSIGYRDYTLLTNPFPSMGGSLIGLALSLLETQDTAKLKYHSPAHALQTAKLMTEVELLREKGINAVSLEQSGERLRLFSRGTTHISVADGEGNVASMTCSNGEGSGYFVPGTGIMLNNMMGEDDLHPEGFHASPPGQRVSSMMSPSLLLKNDAVEMVIGSGGSKRIRTAITQVISSIVDFNIPVQEAVEAPRIHWDGEMMQVEPGYSQDAINVLQKHWPVNLWNTIDVYFGGVHTVLPGIAGGGDPRRGGSVRVLEK